MKIYCFGNEFVKEDSLAKVLSSEIQIPGVEFVKADSVLNIVDASPLYILDVVEGLRKPMLFRDMENFTANPKNAHDLDLGFYLRLLKEMGKLKNIQVIGIPQGGNKEKIKKVLIKLLLQLST